MTNETQLTNFQQQLWDAAVAACQASSSLDRTGTDYFAKKAGDTQAAFRALVERAVDIDSITSLQDAVEILGPLKVLK